MTYSQAGEEEAILAWTRGRRGSFLDLGCYDGKMYSNTLALAELGWAGLCVDAAPDVAARCAIRHGRNPKVDVLCAAFDSENPGGVAALHWTPRQMYSAFELEYRPSVPLLVPRLDLTWLAGYLEAAPRPLFCSIDLEGGSIAALRWLLENAKVDCVCVEANNPVDKAAAEEACDGWKILYENDWNVIYCGSR